MKKDEYSTPFLDKLKKSDAVVIRGREGNSDFVVLTDCAVIELMTLYSLLARSLCLYLSD